MAALGVTTLQFNENSTKITQVNHYLISIINHSWIRFFFPIKQCWRPKDIQQWIILVFCQIPICFHLYLSSILVPPLFLNSPGKVSNFLQYNISSCYHSQGFSSGEDNCKNRLMLENWIYFCLYKHQNSKVTNMFQPTLCAVSPEFESRYKSHQAFFLMSDYQVGKSKSC